MPVKEAEAESGKAKDDPYSKGTLDIVSGGIKIPSSEDKNEGEVNISSPHGKKRAASEDLETEMPKQGDSAMMGTLTASCPPMGQPSAEL